MRQPVKSGIFLLLVFILGILTSGAISVHHAIMNTNQNLRSRMPAVAMIEYDLDFDFEAAWIIYEDTGYWPYVETDVLTREEVHAIGGLPQVRTFDYSINITFDIIAEGLEPWPDPEFFYHLRTESDYGVAIEIGGAKTEDFLDIRANFIELTAGRGFTEEELMTERDLFPVLVASGFAQTNGLTLGSVFDIRVLIREMIEHEDGSFRIDWNSEPTLGATFPLEVIGIFDPLLAPLNVHSSVGSSVYSWQASQMQHRMYVSNLVAEEMVNQLFINLSEGDFTVSFHNLFLLNDSLDFEEFAQAVQNMPGNWRAIDYSRGFDALSLAMIHLQDIADMVLMMAIVAMIAIISLLVLLFLNDRKYEIGVYLALGARKKGIIFQICMEVFILAMFGMTFALFIGNIMARNISQEILRQELMNPTHVREVDHAHWLEELGYRFELTHDEMLGAYEIQLGFQEIIWFYVAGLGTVLVATILPIARIVKTNPKKVLL